ncbi:MAG: efflux RND transporter periplasmic adaptor subunit [Geminicoccaceae bacterium]
MNACIPGLLVVAALTIPIFDAAIAQDRPALVQVDEVRVEPLDQTRGVLGRIVTKQQGQVAARVGGQVVNVLVDVGDRIERGAPLVELDSEPVQYDLDLANAEYEAALADQATAIAEIDLLENEFARLERLRESAAFSKARLEDKTRQITVAKRRESAATARLGQYQAKQRARAKDLDDMVIKAPYAGVVSRKLVSPGAYLRPGDPVVALIDDRSLEVEADVPVDHLGALTPGKVLYVSIGGERYSATVRAIIPEENPLTRTRAVRLVPDFGDEPAKLAVAQSVTLEVPIGRSRDAVTVNKDGIVQSPNGTIVFLVKDQTAAPQPVTLGSAIGGRFEVLGGLEAGDLVVVRGNERLRPGQAVTYPGAPEAAAPQDENSES